MLTYVFVSGVRNNRFSEKFAYILNELSLILRLLITGMQRHFNTNTFWCQFSVVSQLLFFRFFFMLSLALFRYPSNYYFFKIISVT